MDVFKLPKQREALYCLCTLALWFGITVLFLGFRPERVAMALLILAFFFVSLPSRKLIVALMPFVIFGVSYDWMNLLPNYMVNPIHTGQLYDLEKDWFGIAFDGATYTPNEFFAGFDNKFIDFMSGVFYLCWVPVPILFGIYLYFKGRTVNYLHFAMVFLLVNLIGFAGYYLYPAAPPWYIQLYGFEPVTGTPGNVAGLGSFDNMTGLGIFNALYARNSNVFAAMPSLHSAYPLVAFIYSLSRKTPVAWKVLLGVITVGIWFAAVYTSHHYVLDVLGGITVSVAGILIFELILMKTTWFRRFFNRYANYIK